MFWNFICSFDKGKYLILTEFTNLKNLCICHREIDNNKEEGNSEKWTFRNNLLFPHCLVWWYLILEIKDSLIYIYKFYWILHILILKICHLSYEAKFIFGTIRCFHSFFLLCFTIPSYYLCVTYKLCTILLSPLVAISRFLSSVIWLNPAFDTNHTNIEIDFLQ